MLSANSIRMILIIMVLNSRFKTDVKTTKPSRIPGNEPENRREFFPQDKIIRVATFRIKISDQIKMGCKQFALRDSTVTRVTQLNIRSE